MTGRTDLIMLDELNTPKQGGLIEFVRFFRTALNAHKIYPVGHKMIVQSIDRMLKSARRSTTTSAPQFVISLFEDHLEFNGEKIKRRGAEMDYSKEIAGIFKDQRLQTVILRPTTQPREISKLFSLLVTHDPIEDGELDFASLQTQLPSLGLNLTVVRRTIGDKVKEQLPESHYISSADLPAAEPEVPAHDPDEVLGGLPPFVRSGQFMHQILSQYESDDMWPAARLAISDSQGSGMFGTTPLGKSGEFSHFSMPGLDAVSPSHESLDDAPEPDGIGQELMLELEDEPFAPSHPPTPPSGSMVSLPGLPPVGDFSTLPPDLQERLKEEMLKQIDQMVPAAITQTIQQLSSNDPSQAELRRSILEQLTPEALEESQQELVDQIEQASARDEVVGAVELFREMLDQQFEKGILEGASHALAEIEERAEQSGSSSLQAGVAKVREHLQQADKLEHLIEHGVEVKRKDARKLLSQLAPSSLPQCIRALIAAQDREERRRLSELLIELSRNATPEKREAAFRSLITQLKDIDADEQEQEFFLELIRSYSPIQFETYIIQNLTNSNDEAEQALLMRQAISHDSPKLRGLLNKLFEERVFAHAPEQEELLLLYLYRRGVIDVLHLLQESIDNGRQDEGLRHSAVWLLGAIEDERTLGMLKQVLSRENDLGRPYYPDSLRFQALHTLSRLPRTDTEALIRGAREDQSLLVQAHAAFLLNEPVTISSQDDALSRVLAENQAGEEPQPKAIISPEFPVGSISMDDLPAVTEEQWEEDELPPPSLLSHLASREFWSPPMIATVAGLLMTFLVALGWMLGRLFGG